MVFPAIFNFLSDVISLSLCKLSQLKNINSRAFNSSSLQKLIFKENRYRFDKKIRYDSKEIEIFHVLMRFPSKMSDSKFSKHLNERIEMSRIALLNSDNFFSSGTALLLLIQHLSGANLMYISLNYNNLKKLYFNIFRPLSGLKKLYCRENAIAYTNCFVQTLKPSGW
jgi:hypothetical protein